MVSDRIGGPVWSLVGMIRSIIQQCQIGVIDQPRATPWEQVTPWRVSPERMEKCYAALSGLAMSRAIDPRALPWAVVVCPFRAESIRSASG
jgi:hypothetical protein